MAEAAEPTNADFVPSDELTHYEIFWREHQRWLETCGYRLRRRYQEDWIPSWAGRPSERRKSEDSVEARGPVIDATRISDGLSVALKRINRSVPHFAIETDIGLYFSTPPRAAHPQNHCVPIYEVLRVFDDNRYEIIVMPGLRDFTSPRFETFGEIGIQFMHSHHIVHRDCQSGNIMMDASKLYADGFHPQQYWLDRDWKYDAKQSSTRTKCNPRYHLIDFGLSRLYHPSNGPPEDLPVFGGDKTVPEFQGEGRQRPYNPFPTDIYYLGSMVRTEFIQTYFGCKFLQPLVDAMVADDPTQRPTILEVCVQFDKLRRYLSTWKLRSRPVRRKELWDGILGNGIVHVFRRIGYILRRIPP
ncbi:hypothetical protein C8R43DRAFT_1010342 [Mycena crocata]|nr:hypothetical protein C8R43DRAFT_1010342 [Mycena crocata]